MNQTHEPAGGADPLPAPRLLLLEDEELVQALVRFALEDTGIECVHCRTVAAAREILRAGHFDVLVADLTLPGESGLSFLRGLAGEAGYHPGLQVITFSSGLTGLVRRELQSLGVRHMLAKPASVDAVRQCVAQALALSGAATSRTRGTLPPASASTLERPDGGAAASVRP